MVGILVKVVVGLLLFVGSVVGGLAATGRLNHEGTANIPVLGGFFPPPPAPTPEELAAAAAAGTPADASHAGDGVGVAEASGQDPHGKAATPAPAGEILPPRPGRSVLEPEAPKKGGGGHGAEPEAKGDAHGAKKDDGHGAAKADAHGADKTAAGTDHGKAAGAGAANGAGGKGQHDAERDFAAMEVALAQDRANKYAPGKYFRFEGLPAGLTPEQINEAWQRVEATMAELERRRIALDLREKELQDLAADLAKRHQDLASERTALEGLQTKIDTRLAEFESQIRLVKKEEEDGLRRNAKTYDALERDKVAMILRDSWKTETGQTQFLKLMEFMNPEAVNEVLALLETALLQDVMEKRLTVKKESTARANPR